MAATTAAPARPTLVPRGGLALDAALVSTGALLISLAAQISIPLPFTPVPITGQTFAVLLVGAGLGTARGGAAGVLYVLLGLAGLPVYAHGAHGLAELTGATGGYLVAFPIASALTGLLAELRWDRRFSSALGAMLTGNLLVYLVGVPWLAASLHVSVAKALALGLYPFVAGDALKLYLAAALLPAAWRLTRR